MSMENPYANPMHNQEGELKKFLYKDNTNSGAIIFECEAIDILDADSMYKEVMKNDPSKQPHIGCTIEEIEKPQ
jgi:hypothetical protein